MIRRDSTAPDGAPHWTLIPQIQHARLAAQLATDWGDEAFAELARWQGVLPAIAHHDDGWADWDAAPETDPERGWPRSFMEMPIERSLAIWRDSIERSARFGNLAAWIVASHFIIRLRHASSAGTARARAWVDEIGPRRAHWFAAWHGEDPPTHRREVADRALAYLRMFDALSLWFCCAERTQPHMQTTPEGLVLRFAPQQSGRVGISPWPLSVPRLDLMVTGRTIPRGRYPDRTALAAARATETCLQWRLVPTGK